MIEFQNASFSYRGSGETGQASCALAGIRDVSLAVEDGTCVLVCGGSGCGKSTMTRLANGLAPSFFPGEATGRVLVDGRDVASMESWEVAAHLGSVFQNPRTQFFNVDSTGEVAFALESMAWHEDEVRTRTHETIAELGLEELADRSIFSLSGGEKQRIAYASVWAPHPQNLVLDEPTSNLDRGAIADLRGYLADAKARGTAILVAEHRLWWLIEVADVIAHLENGRVVRTMHAPEFCALPSAEIRAMGLRARDLSTVGVRKACDDACASPAGAEPGPAASRTPASAERVHAAPASDPAEHGAPILEALDLRAAYGKREVLRGVSCAVHAGEVVALIGSNGAGKSTLCRTLVGLHKEGAGSVLLDGEEAKAKDRLRASSMVFQDVNYQLFAESVKAETVFGLEGPKRPTDAQVAEILDRLGLSEFAERHPATLSGGQKQRLAVAACIASGKRLLVFDEPTSGLDLGSMIAVSDLVRTLASGGRAVLVVTHDLEFIACACDRVLLVEEGVIGAEAPVAGDLAEVRALLAAGGGA